MFLIKLEKNHYKMTINDNFFIEFRVLFDKEVLITSKNISNDNVLFISGGLPTEATDNPIIGYALSFRNKICIGNDLIEAEILDSNVENSKTILESLFAQ